MNCNQFLFILITAINLLKGKNNLKEKTLSNIFLMLKKWWIKELCVLVIQQICVLVIHQICVLVVHQIDPS
jgi:hypothetical protein